VFQILFLLHRDVVADWSSVLPCELTFHNLLTHQVLGEMYEPKSFAFLSWNFLIAGL
jgi:hypothetical protein